MDPTASSCRPTRLAVLSLAALLLLAAAPTQAGETVPLDDPSYALLAQLRADGKLPLYLGGQRPLDRQRIEELLRGAGAPVPAWIESGSDGFWLRPVSRVSLRAAGVSENDRTYDQPTRLRQQTGFVALSCEHQEGRPCGDGAGAGLEVDSAAGFSRWLAAGSRLRASWGSDRYQDVEVDRLYLRGVIGGLVEVEAGRDVLALGPAVRSGLMWSDHAAPTDHVRLATARPWNFLGQDGETLRGSAMLWVSRLRGPQDHPGVVLIGQRGQLDFFDTVEFGGTRFLELGGQGTPAINSVWYELFGRQSTRPGVIGPENNRLGFDLAIAPRGLHGAKLYYELALEDTRRQLLSMLQWDGDHLVGLSLPQIDAGPLRAALVELHRTGYVSQEHFLFTTGMSNAGRLLGSPLGSDAWSLYLRADLASALEAHQLVLSPWIEWLGIGSGTFSANFHEPVYRLSYGITEHRQRAGLEAKLDLDPRELPALFPKAQLSARAYAERIGNYAFQTGDTRFGGGGEVALTLWAAGAQ